MSDLTHPHTFEGTPKISLRTYQTKCLSALKEKIDNGATRLLVAMATGSGKTVVFSHLPSMYPGVWLVLAHRTELLEQARDKILKTNPWCRVGIEQAVRTAGNVDVVVASVQSLQGRRLQSVDPATIRGIICDECHHATARTYVNIFNHFGILHEHNKIPLVGFTATPQRGDSIGLSSVFDEIVYEYGIQDGIDDGHLAPLTGWRIGTGVDISGVKTSRGDYAQGQLAAAIDTVPRNAHIVRKYIELASRRRAIVFAASVAHSQHLTDCFQAHGVSSAHIDGKTHPERRREVLERFANGELKVVSNCAVLTEGFDSPATSCIIMARPTQSPLLYAQMVGRGTRTYPGKENCLVLDFADSSKQNRICSVASLLGLPARLDLKGEPASQAKKQIEEAMEKAPYLNLDSLSSLGELSTASIRIDFFGTKPPPEIARCSRFVWVKLADGGFMLSLPARESVTLMPTRLDKWEIHFKSIKGNVVLSTKDSLELAIAEAEDTIRRGRRDVLPLIERSASWRKVPASEKQLSLLRRLGVSVPKGINKGHAASIITFKFSERKK